MRRRNRTSSETPYWEVEFHGLLSEDCLHQICLKAYSEGDDRWEAAVGGGGGRMRETIGERKNKVIALSRDTNRQKRSREITWRGGVAAKSRCREV